jgi:Flp pilus assembly protein TadG
MSRAMRLLERIQISVRNRLFALATDQRGLAAVEFGMLLPLLVTLYFGGVEVSQAVSIDRKVSLTARVIADLVSRGTTISNDEMTTILTASATVAAPYSSSKLKVVVSSVKIDSNGIATVDWSDATSNATALEKGAFVTVPDGLKVNNTYVIWATANYQYTPTIGYVITGDLNLSDGIYMRPRSQDRVCRVTCS